MSHASVVEYAVFNYPKGLEQYRFIRIEYYNEEDVYAFREEHLWVPNKTDLNKLEEALNGE